MKIAVCSENGEVFQHFGHTPEFLVCEVADGKVVSSEIVSSGGNGHGALAGLLGENKIDLLICGGIGGGAMAALAEAGVEVIGGVSGDAKAAVDAREAVTEEQKEAAAALVGIREGMLVKNAAGKEGIVAIDEKEPLQRKMPTFENALEPKKVVDESNAYSKPVEQKTRFEEWSV